MDTAGDEAWPKHLKDACSPEESSEAPFSFFCCSSYERMDCRASCFLHTRTRVITGRSGGVMVCGGGGGHSHSGQKQYEQHDGWMVLELI